MVIQEVVTQHAGEAAFLWTLRHHAVRDPTHSLRSLTTLDERVEAHLDGLRIAGDAAWALCRTNVQNAEAGEVFPLAVLSFEAGDRQWMLDTLTLGCTSDDTRRGLVSALGWLDYQTVAHWIHKLVAAKSPVHRAIGIAANAVHRRDPGDALTAALDDPDPALRARTLRAIGELKRQDLLPRVYARLADQDEACRFWAAWTMTLCGEPAGLTGLTQWLGRNGIFGLVALQLSLRVMTLENGREWIRIMAKDPARRRDAVIGAGTLGDPMSVPWLIGNMRVPELARLAGEAFSTITGVDLKGANLEQRDPPEADGDEEPLDSAAESDGDSRLPRPDAGRVEEWWQSHGTGFEPGVRYLSGQPITTQVARQVLVAGWQRQRAAAALELAVREHDTVLFEVRGRGSRQQRQLEGHAGS